MGKDQKDFSLSANKTVRAGLRIGEWRVFDRYDVEDEPHGLYIHAPHTYLVPTSDQRGREYGRVVFQFDYLYVGHKGFRPLVDTPTLFLEFAGLIEEGEITQDVWLDWIERYGVLGFEGNGQTEDSWWANPRGGPRETLTAFKDAAWRANAVLRIYEAAAIPEGPDTAVLSKFASKAGSPIPGMEGLVKFDGEESPAALKAWGLREVWSTVGSLIAGHCYPALYRQSDSFLRGVGFKSLLGAMYLQMEWLMSATDKPARCKWTDCTHFVTLEQPQHVMSFEAEKSVRSKYRTRKDKEFCSNKCRNRWHYHYGGGKYSKSTRRKRQSPDRDPSD